MLEFQSPHSADLMAYWQKARSGRAMPATEDFFDHVPAALAALAPLLILFECTNADLIMRYVGTMVVERWGQNMTGESWPRHNSHLNASHLLANFALLQAQPCAAHALSAFVTCAGRNLSIETVSFPLSVREGRPPRIISGTFTLEALGHNEHSQGWMPPRAIRWIDVGFGIPATLPKTP